MNTQDQLLHVSGLRIEAKSEGIWKPLVHELDLELRKGEVLGLIGESGAGKSTIGLAAMGYARPGCRIAAGTILFDGRDLALASEAERTKLRGSRIAYVAQSAAAAFNPAHRLIEQCTEVAVEHQVKTKDAASRDAIALYKEMRLPEPESIGFRYPHEVSGGQLQRAMTAMAMICQPDLIIFDEPTTALDVTTQIEVLASIRGIVERHHTAAIYISHDLAIVAQMADRIMVLQNGRLVEQAPTRTMLSAPREIYTQTLWAVRQFKTVEKARTAAESPQLSVSDLNASYGLVKVLKDVSFDVFPQRTVAVVGESGSGKSTLAKVIAGLLPARSGQVALDGKPLPTSYKNRSIEELRSIQLVHQMPDAALNPKQTVGTIIERPLKLYTGLNAKARGERIAELLSLLELEPREYIGRRPAQLSGGQKQRVCIGRALAAEPRLMICDEVTSALDQIVTEGILKLLARIQSELGISYIFITHDLTLVRAIADEVVVMKDGVVVEAGSKSSVIASPRSPYTKLLLSAVPEMDPDWLTRRLRTRLE
ncbi:MAG: ABC transporter ATP-binding protein [Dongiaceae bacterium]